MNPAPASRRHWPCLLLLLLTPSAASALSFSADLSSLQIDGHLGEAINRTFELRLAPQEAATEFVARVEDWWTNEDGTSSYYRPVGSVPHSCGSWVELNPVEAQVAAGGTLSVHVTTTIPLDAAPGGYWCVLTIDEVPNPLAASGVGIHFKSSVSVGIFVDLAPVERAARILEIEVAGSHAGVVLRNDGNAPIRVEGRFEFFRHGESVPVAVTSLPRTTLLLDPAPIRRIWTELPDLAALPAGRYLVRAVLDLGLDHYLGAQKEIEIGARRSAPRPAP